jgi:hypothetical protein
MFKITDESGYTKIVVEGKLKHSDYIDNLIPKFEKIVKTGSMKVMVIMDQFEGIGLKAMLDDLKTACKYRKDFHKVAVVTQSIWMKAGLNIFSIIVAGKVATFVNEHEAQEWLIK